MSVDNLSQENVAEHPTAAGKQQLQGRTSNFTTSKFTQTGIFSALWYIKQTTPSPPPSLSLLLTRSLSPLLSFPPIFLRVSPRLFVAPQS